MKNRGTLGIDAVLRTPHPIMPRLSTAECRIRRHTENPRLLSFGIFVCVRLVYGRTDSREERLCARRGMDTA